MKKDTKKKPFNQSLYNKLMATALLAVTAFMVLLTWMMFDLQRIDMQVNDSLAEQVFQLQIKE